MKRSGLAILGLLVLVSMKESVRPPMPEPSRAIMPLGEPIVLFNGRDLSGFYTWLVDTKKEDPRKVFSVKDGMICISGDGFGYLATEKRYWNYELVVEFKWGEKNFQGRESKARDSGIFLHANGPDGNSEDGNGAYKAAVECQIMEGAVGDLLKIRGKWIVEKDGFKAEMKDWPQWKASVSQQRDVDGYRWWRKDQGLVKQVEHAGRLNWKSKDQDWKDEFGFRGKADVESQAGQWTKVRCVCRGGAMTILVNDQVVNQVQELSMMSGQILLQCEGSEIYFRKLELRPLPSADPFR